MVEVIGSIPILPTPSPVSVKGMGLFIAAFTKPGAMSVMKVARMLAVCALAGALQLAGAPAARAQAALQKALAAHLRQNKDDVEDPDCREVRYSDMNGDGVLDAVVSYTLDQRGTLNYSCYLAVFLRRKGTYHLAADELVGGKFFGAFVIKSIVKGVITAQAVDYIQGAKSNSVEKRVRLTLVGGKLRGR